MSRPRIFGLGAAGAVIAIFVAANAHLVTVAIGSQPDCALAPSHQKGVALRAAKPSC